MAKWKQITAHLFHNWRGDLFGGTTAAIVALPLALAFGVLSGAGAMAGLYSAVFIGILAAAFGGCPAQVSGPTAGMTVILVPIFHTYGLAGLFMAMFMAGAILILLSLLKVGRHIHLISQPVLSGFTNGIAMLIFLQQLGSLRTPGGGFHLPAAALAASVVALMLAWPRVTRKVPGSLLALVGSTLLVHRLWPTMFPLIGAIPGGWPTLELGFISASVPNILGLLKPAIVIALLGGIESLLASVVVDEMAGTRHDPDRELFGQGLGNLIAPLFGGIAGTGAIVRSAANVQAGGLTRLSGVIHGLWLLLVAVALGDLAALIPKAALAGILMATAINMVDRRSLADLRRVPLGDAGIMVTTAVLTVAVDLVTAVAVGVLLSMVRYALTMTSGPLQVQQEDGVTRITLTGSLFFGLARPFLDAVESAGPGSRLEIDVSQVYVLDSTGAKALAKGYEKAQEMGCQVVWSGVQPKVEELLARMGSLPPTLMKGTS